jgi:hypothetical protein
MTEGFNLSEKIGNRNYNRKYMKDDLANYFVDDLIHKDDVKEFIRLLKETISNTLSSAYIINDYINKLAGEKLI